MMQKLIGEPPARITPVEELVNVFELEDMAKRKLESATFAAISGSERSAFDRITFRPRMMVDTMKLDMSADLFGQTVFTPILVGPASEQKRFHPEGELAMVRGASAGKALMVVADRSSFPIDEIAAQAKTTLWYQTYADPNIGEVRRRVQQAVKAGCRAVCVTIGSGGAAGNRGTSAGVDWRAIDRLRQGLSVPFLVKGIMSPEEAQKAAGMGVQGIVVSNYAGPGITGVASPIEMLPSISDAAGGKMVILIDGSFRRGSDILKALALGAQGVLLGRPALWGLAAYGSDGVQKAVELLQTELARDMAGCGRINVKSVNRSAVKIHSR